VSALVLVRREVTRNAVVAGGALVGSSSQDDLASRIAAHGVVVDSGYTRLENEVAKYTPGTVEDQTWLAAWRADLVAWRIRWSAIKDTTPLPWLDDDILEDIRQYDLRLRQREREARARGIAVTLTTTPVPDKGGGPIDRATDTVSTVVWILGIGLLVYLGLAYVAPTLIGAAATTRAAARGYRTS